MFYEWYRSLTMDTNKRKQLIEKYWKRCAICDQGIKDGEIIILLNRKKIINDHTSGTGWSINEQTQFKNTGLAHVMILHETCFIKETGEDFIFWKDEDEI